MSSNYSPYYTSEAAGEDLSGTMVNDRASGPDAPLTYEAAMGPPAVIPEATPPQGMPSYINALGATAGSAADRLRTHQAAKMAAQTDQEPFFNSFTINQKTGTVKVDMSQGALAEVMAQLTDLKTMKAAAMARVAQLRQQEASGSPILDALSQLAGGMAANDPTMPGWVRALGATNLSMGKQGIKRERMAEEAKVLQLGQSQAQIARAILQDEREERQLGLQEKSFAAAQADKTAARVEAAAKDVFGRYKDEVDKGRPVDPMLIATELAAAGLSKERAIAAATQMAQQADVNRKEIEAARSADIRSKQELEKFKSDLALRNDLSLEGRREAFKMAELGFNRNTELEKIDKAAEAKRAGERKLPNNARETLIQINALDEKLDSLKQRAAKYKGYMGIGMGRVGTAIQNIPGISSSEWAAERKAIQSELQRFVAQYVKAVQGGGNTISNKDVENAAKSLPNLNVPYEQFAALIDSIKDEGQYQRDVFRRAYEADWEGRDKNLLGTPRKPKAAPGLPAVPTGWRIEEVK